jgi:uncharacterized OsmC-like protein
MSTVKAQHVAENSGSPRALTSGRDLFVLQHDRRDGFWANIRGHVLDLADPDTGDGLAPNPDDLFVLSIASELAWTARKILRARGLPDEVSVSAKWRATADPSTLSDVDLTVTVSGRADAVGAALAAAVDNSLIARSLVNPVARISWKGANR